ncbi:hypothetical protein Vretifemale_20557 [Volvox reticuliferus]|uniref:Thiamine pyrophosphate enzyme N-terminal TPP-binding domain-containing protein n=1 Tax=Volvox reticuliferus TaxID=1737510 RepID=A0A8J4D1A2_9CHLO|nr:hypothetical protein Vretifemale_20557 [Volvox reticuliferus]
MRSGRSWTSRCGPCHLRYWPPRCPPPPPTSKWPGGALLVEELCRLGVNMFCVAPGSRSSPLAHAIASHPRARLNVCIDERSLGFWALGYGRSSGRPAAVVTSSGTAVANLLPAVVEASLSGVPLLLLTADRPAELRDTAANQTIDQTRRDLVITDLSHGSTSAALRWDPRRRHGPHFLMSLTVRTLYICTPLTPLASNGLIALSSSPRGAPSTLYSRRVSSDTDSTCSIGMPYFRNAVIHPTRDEERCEDMEDEMGHAH